tara:strand:- start:1983 stop:2660 length:678 start_codon:yes stop_codon:yes gene_type:complete
MIWDDEGYLISKVKYSENSIIANFFTKNHGKTSGMIFGATSKKIKSYLMTGNFFNITFNSKNENKSGYFKLEISKINTPHYLDDNLKLSAILYAMNLIKILTAENQSNIKIFTLINDFYKILNNENWVKDFILWELNILKNLGYDLNFKNYAICTKINGIDQFVVKTDNKRIIPNFLINNNLNPKNKNELIISLKLVGDFLEKTILRPNNINTPLSRSNFLNLLV